MDRFSDDRTLDPANPAVNESPSSAASLDQFAGEDGSGQNLGAAPGRAQTDPILEVGTILGGRYEILGLVGVGGMGAVYKARDNDIDRIIAIKVIRPDLLGHPELVQRFKQELLLARQIAHKNVVRIFDVRESAGLRFITMEYVDGPNLSTLLEQRGKFPADEAVEIILQVCAGLDAAHGEGVLHRDLKTSNIMLDGDGRLVVMDFGLAHKIGTCGITQTGAMLGTIRYMSPEQATGEPLDCRSDLFAVGLILYELLTGNGPYDAESDLASLVKRTKERARPLRAVEESVAPALSAVVAKCLERNPQDRYSNLHELSLALTQVSGRSASAVDVKGRWFARRIWKTTAVIFLLLVLASAVGIWRFRPRKTEAIHAPVTVLISDFENNTSESIFDGTLEPAFSLAMEGAPFISTYSSGAAHKLAAQLHPGATRIDAGLGKLIAIREGLHDLITGSISRRGQLYVVTSEARDALTDKTIARSTVTAANSKVLVAMNELAANIRQALGDTTPISAQIASAETFTASSLEAAHEYGLGQDALWAGNYQEAIQHYKKSLHADPDLGRAYSGLAVISVILGHQQDALNYYKSALSKLDRMSEREKLRTLSAYYTVTRDTDEAIEELNQLISRYPADTSGYANLALAYFYRRDMHRALEEGKRAVEISPRNVLQRNNVGLYAMYAGDFQDAIREQKQVLEMNPSLVKGFVGIALSQAASNDLEAARKTYHEMEGAGDEGQSIAAMGLADLALYVGDAAQAKAILDPAIKTDLADKNLDGAAAKLVTLAAAELCLNNLKSAVDSASRALESSNDTRVTFLAARVLEHGKAKDRAKAVELARNLSARIDDDSRAFGNLLLGELELQRGKTRDAVDRFKEALHYADAWLVRFDLGRAYVSLGQYAQADSELELCLKRRGEATAAFLDEVPTIRLLPDAYYFLARTQQGLNLPSAAQTQRTFIEMRPKGRLMD